MLWLIVSKAELKSTRSKMVPHFLSIVVLTALVTYSSAVSVECFFPIRRLKAVNHLLVRYMHHYPKRGHFLNYFG
ncbi:hypothetical protein NP493_607g00007 [Ridgeia piscesae]|uniref:Uncharacterized protein n=1 Tax=Ridgeia piscesae TaxID=27915 RepID=A0AAD9KTZ0_RIDPI|nr:hypothetical protein NP493_607g00007 [Ridgeia piscesae]